MMRSAVAGNRRVGQSFKQAFGTLVHSKGVTMSIRNRFLAAAAVLSLAPGAAFAQERPDVQELANRWTAAYNQVDVPALAALYADDAELYIHNDSRYVGRQDISDFRASDMQFSNPITVLNVTDAVSDPEMVLVHGNYQVLDRTSGVPSEADASRISGCWRIMNGCWTATYGWIG